MADLDEGQNRAPRAEHYPPCVVGVEQERRWDLALAIARLIFDTAPDVWLATRSIYRSAIATEVPGVDDQR